MRIIGAILFAIATFAGSCFANEQHDRALLRAFFNGDMAGVQTELNAGANINAEFDETPQAFPLDVLVSAVAGHNPPALSFALTASVIIQRAQGPQACNMVLVRIEG